MWKMITWILVPCYEMLGSKKMYPRSWTKLLVRMNLCDRPVLNSSNIFYFFLLLIFYFIFEWFLLIYPCVMDNKNEFVTCSSKPNVVDLHLGIRWAFESTHFECPACPGP